MNVDAKRWVYLFVCVVINLCAGFIYSWSVFQKPLMEHFGVSSASISLAFTVIMGGSALPMALVGKVQEYVAPRQIILAGGILLGTGVMGIGYARTIEGLLLFSLLIGVGVGITYPGTVTNMVRWFPDHRGLASGLLAGGMGAGATIISPLAVFLIQEYGLLVSFKILGIAFLCIIGGLSRSIPTAAENYAPTKGLHNAKNMAFIATKNKAWRDMLLDPMFYILAGMFIIAAISGMMIMGHASPIAQEKLNITPQEASVLVSMLALSNMSGRIAWGWISDQTGHYFAMLLMLLIMGAAMFALTNMNGHDAVVAAMLSIVFCYGGFMGTMAAVTANSFGTKYLGVNFGIMFLTIAIAAFIGPRLVAILNETRNGDYSLAFLIATVLCGGGILLNLAAQRKLKSIHKVGT